MKLFLTGATGVIGTRALPALVAAGHDVTAVARGDAKADLVRSLGGTPTAVDLFDPDAVTTAVAGHEAVVHLATNIPPMTRAARASAWATNERLRTEASAHLVDAALAAGATHYLQESITFPYEDGGDQWVDEDQPRTVEGPFAGAARAEAQAERFARDGGTGVVLRFAQFYAPGASHTTTFSRMARRRINPFIGPPDAYISHIHAEDAGAAVAAGLDVPSGTYNVADDTPMTRAAAGRAVADALGVGPPRAVPQALMPGLAKLLMRSLRVSNRRFRAASGWAPAHPSIEGSWPTEGTS